MFREWNIWSKIHLNCNFFSLLLMLVHVLNPSFGDMWQRKISSLVVWLHFFLLSLVDDHFKDCLSFFKLTLNIRYRAYILRNLLSVQDGIHPVHAPCLSCNFILCIFYLEKVKMLLYHHPLHRWDNEVPYSFQTEKKINFKSALRVMVYKSR